ncbi:MAG: family 20 glycosylhydrolase [bacterium]|nr:family 20 glycosylhydrolase [bacterium]
MSWRLFNASALKAALCVAASLVSTTVIGVQPTAESKHISSSSFPVRGFCIAAPRPAQLSEFIRFIEDELVPAGANTLVLRVDYNFDFQSHPELRDPITLSRSDVERLVKTCRLGGIRVIPQFNLLGHQSWHERILHLLRVYPHLDETPHIDLPEKYEWPNSDNLYCKSYCPRHPEVHPIVLALVDELVEAFEADAFHAGMDEVFYIGDDKCPRCAGSDKAELFAAEVTLLGNHLAGSNCELWIWGDRLIDGRTTGIGMWEASMNSTHRAIDLIPKDVVICDWHYERAVPTAPYFASKGFQVVSCPWNLAVVGIEQIRAIKRHRNNSTPEMRQRFLGVMQTIWSEPESFLDQFYGRAEPDRGNGDPIGCAKALLAEFEAASPATDR